MILGTIGPWQILLLVFALFSLLIPIIALIDILRHEFTGSNKVVWVLVVLFLNLFGVLLYLALGRKQRILN